MINRGVCDVTGGSSSWSDKIGEGDRSRTADFLRSAS